MIRLRSLKAQGIKNLEIPAEEDDFDRLNFPECGKVFIHGLNEAGKSTLFESIYFALFGTALIPNRSKASMSELLAYDRDKGVVELEFTIEDSLYRIRRSIKDSGSRMSYGHKLVIEHPGQDPEGIKGASDVNKRIKQELGLDGDALLNSCFVQQKSMDRLEDSRKKKREESIAILLNLDRFTSMESNYSSKQDQASEELERARQKLEIAKLEEEKIPDKEDQKSEVESKLNVIEWKNNIKELKDDVKGYKTRIQSRIDEIQGLARNIQDIKEIEQSLPDKQERKQSLDKLYTDLASLEDLDEAIDNLENLKSLDGEIEDLNSEISDLESERDSLKEQLEAVRSKLEEYEYLDLLREWERLKNAATREERIEEQEQEYEQKKQQAKQKLDEVKQEKSDVASTRKTTIGIGAGVSILSLVAGAVGPALAFAGVVLGLGVAAYGYFGYDPSQYDSEIESLDEDISGFDTELTKLEGRRDDLNDTETERPSEEIGNVEDQIKDLEQTVPSSLDECESLESEVKQRLENEPDQSELESKESKFSNKLSRKKQEISSQKKTLDEKKETRENLDEEEIEDRIRRVKIDIVGEQKSSDKIEEELKSQAKELGVEADKQDVNSEKSSLQTEIRNDKERISRQSKINSQIEEKNQTVSQLQDKISTAEDKIERFEIKIEEADSDPDIGQETELNEERDEIVAKLRNLRTSRDELRNELSLTDDLNLSQVKSEVSEKKHALDVFEYSEEIVRKSKKQVMNNILPKTEANMARFLPILTDGRYKDVRIDADSYRIEAYDSRAQSYKSKSIFSGGTKDQFSLALRLSFAMATLPQERGTTPDFLYLDEPVGSFDSSRQEALTELLTRGEIAESFDQIFIVSHVEELQKEFDHRIKMEDGRIAEKELEN